MTIRERIEKVSENWFLMEPAFFGLYCTHAIEANGKMQCPVRSGKGKIEYNEALLEQFSDKQLDQILRAEMIRIFLKHPYDRQPENCRSAAVTYGSDCVLTGNYKDLDQIQLADSDSFGLPIGEAFEWYAHQINVLLPSDDGDGGGEGDEDESGKDSSGQDEGAQSGKDSPSYDKDDPSGNGSQGYDEEVPSGNGSHDESKGEQVGAGQGDVDEPSNFPQQEAAAEQSALWEEDQLMQQIVNDQIENTTSWGSIGGKLREQIIASTKPQIDYRRAFAGFRSSILSTRRHLTRMRPNRRAEFEQMGSVYELTTRLLVAVDVSGSVSRTQLGHFYSLMNRFFKYGIEQMDVVQFDAALGEVAPLKKAKQEMEVCGRGGTSFQPVIDYAKEQKYDGLVILTDGYAPAPTIPLGFHTPILWVTSCEREYNDGRTWMERLPHSRACFLRLP